MRRPRSAILRLSALAIILGCITVRQFSANAEQALPPEEITLTLGAVFEILAQSAEPGTQYAWTLSLDRTFLQAERGRSFRTRFSQPGRYRLSTEVLPPSGSSIRKVFVINVRTDAAAIPPAQASIETDPPASSEGVIILPEGKSVVRLSAAAEHQNAIALDANTATDEDQDGDARNDSSALGTYFTTDVVPLWLWCSDTLPSTIAITTSGKEGTTAQQQFSVTREGLGIIVQKPEVAQGEIQIEDRGNGVLRLGYDAKTIGIGVVPLALWDFGDGEHSMISNPVHRYSASGSYLVRLQITDLRNGTVTKDITQSIAVVVEHRESTAPIPPKPETEPVPTPPKEESTSSILPLLYRIVGVAASAIAFGAMIMALVGILRKKRKSLQQHLEDADKKMAIGKEAAKENIVEGTVAPLALEEMPESAIESASTPEQPTEEILGPAPAWLNPKPSPATSASALPNVSVEAVPVVSAEQMPPQSVTPEPLPQTQTPDAPVAPSNVPAPVAVQSPAPLVAEVPQPEGVVNTPPAPNEVATSKEPIVLNTKQISTEKESEETEPIISENGDLPAWLQPKTSTPAPAPALAPTPAPTSSPLPTPSPTSPLAPSPASSLTPSPAPVPVQVVPKPAVSQTENPAVSPQVQISDKERERRRLKRQRYRANVRRREEEKVGQPTSPQTAPETAVTGDTPIAIVRVENISQQSAAPSNPPSTPASTTEKSS